jgi:hypothetical protein
MCPNCLLYFDTIGDFESNLETRLIQYLNLKNIWSQRPEYGIKNRNEVLKALVKVGQDKSISIMVQNLYMFSNGRIDAVKIKVRNQYRKFVSVDSAVSSIVINLDTFRVGKAILNSADKSEAEVFEFIRYAILHGYLFTRIVDCSPGMLNFAEQELGFHYPLWESYLYNPETKSVSLYYQESGAIGFPLENHLKIKAYFGFTVQWWKQLDAEDSRNSKRNLALQDLEQKYTNL